MGGVVSGRGRFQGRGCSPEAWEWDQVKWEELVGWKETGEWEWSSRSWLREVMGSRTSVLRTWRSERKDGGEEMRVELWLPRG